MAIDLYRIIEENPNPNHKTRDSFCPQCGSPEIEYDKDFGFYKCSQCGHCWGYDEDDPDYDELDTLD